MAIQPMLLTVKCPSVKSFSFKAKFLLNNQENYRWWALENVSESKLSMCTVCMSLALLYQVTLFNSKYDGFIKHTQVLGFLCILGFAIEKHKAL